MKGRDFWLLWTVGLVVYAVRFIETVGIAVYVYQLSDSAFVVAAMSLLRLLPMAMFGVILGTILDGFERRWSLFAILAGLLVLDAALASVIWAGALQTWHLAAASFFGGFAWAADNPVRRLMIAEVVGVARLERAMAFDVATNNACRLGGPLVGGAVFGLFGMFGIFVISLLLYSVALSCALIVRYRSTPDSHATSTTFKRFGDSLKLSWANRGLRKIFVISCLSSLFGWPFTSMVPVIGHDHLHLNPEQIGLLAGMEGLGAIVATIIVAANAIPNLGPLIFVAGAFLYQGAPIFFALTSDPYVAGAAIFVAGLGNAGMMTMQLTLVYALTPVEMRGRLLGFTSAANGIGVLGFLMVGYIADRIGAGPSIILTSVIGLLGLVAAVQGRPIFSEAGPTAGQVPTRSATTRRRPQSVGLTKR
jgi:MFS family permease